MEERFREAVTTGTMFDGSGGSIDAELIRSFCVRHAGQVDPRGIKLRAVTVTGVLDLTAVAVPFALRFEQCSFETAPILHGAQVKELALVGCDLPGLLANGIIVLGDLELSASHIVGAHPTNASISRSAAVWLCESAVGGRLRCIDTVIDPQGERAIQADRMHVGSTIRLIHGFHAKGELRLVGMRVTGSLDMTGARVEAEGLAVDLGDATISGNLYLSPWEAPARRPEIRGQVNLSSTHIDGQLLIRDADLTSAAQGQGRHYSPRFRGKALIGHRLIVGGELSIEGATTVTGGIDLSSAQLGRFAVGSGGLVKAPGRPAIDLTNAEIRSAVTIGAGVAVQGTLLLVGARVRGSLELDGVRLSDPDGHSLLKTDGAVIEGDVTMQGLHAVGGQLKFWRTTIGGGVEAARAVAENPTGATVRLHQSEVRGSVRLCHGFRSVGCVVLSRTVVSGRLGLDGGRFHCPDPGQYNEEGAAIRAVAATFGGGMDLGQASISPAINLTDVTTTVLEDDPGAWPERIYIAGFTYERFDAPRGMKDAGRVWDWERRLEWLRRQPDYDASPYEQAARVFRQHGYEDGAEELLITRRKDARRLEANVGGLRTRGRRALDWIYDWTVGYGFRPGRVLLLLVALLAVVSLTLVAPGVQRTMRASDEGTVFTIDGPVDRSGHSDPCGGGQVRCFSPVLYAVDTVVPLIALDQRATWYPDRFVAGGQAVEWWLNLSTVVGWLLSSIFLLSFARIARTT